MENVNAIKYNDKNKELEIIPSSFKFTKIISKSLEEIKNKSNNFNVAFVYLLKADFENHKTFNTIADKIAKNGYVFSDENILHKPIIFISKFNFHRDNIKGIDSRYRFFDSSIWMKFISEDELYKEIDTDNTKLKDNTDKESPLDDLLNEINENWINGLYDKQINRNSFIFHSYLVKNVFFDNTPNNRNVKPFTFHSETETKKRLKIFLNDKEKKDANFHINTLSNLKWKFLLVAENKDSKKEERIKSLLNKIAHFHKIDKDTKPVLNPTNNISYSIETVNSVKKASEALINSQYDIILTDYLLDDDKSSIELISKLEGNIHKKGPFGRNWIFPITVFSEAFFNDLREENLGHINNNSYVNTGADPYNTPYLFLYKLVMFMNLQLKEVVFTVAHLNKLFSTFLEKITSDKDHVKRSASASYGELMYKYGRKSIIAFDKAENSSLANSLYYNYLRNDADGIIQKFEHIREFLYLLSFGGIDDRTKLISELIFINEQIKPLILSNVKDDKEKIDNEIKEKIDKEIKEKIDNEIKEKIDKEIKEKIDNEIKEKIDKEIKEKIDKEIKEKIDKEIKEIKEKIDKIKESFNILNKYVYELV